MNFEFLKKVFKFFSFSSFSIHNSSFSFTSPLVAEGKKIKKKTLHFGGNIVKLDYAI
jgi:hypothetical protein